jgi:hypothetical protein
MIDERTIELIHGGLDGELSDAENAELEARLGQSDEARHYQAQMRELSVFLDRAPEQEVPGGLREKILGQIELPAEKRGGVEFRFSRIPGFIRYGLAAAAGLLLAIGIYEYRPAGSDSPDLADMVGTVMPRTAAGEVVLDTYSFEIDRLSSSVSLQESDGGLVLDVQLDSTGPVDIIVDFTSDGLQFDAIAQLQSDLGSIEVADRAIQIKSRGRQHFAVLLHRDDETADGTAATIRLDFSSEGKLLNSGKLTTK